MKKYLWEHFLPMWAKQTLLQEHRTLQARFEALRQENGQLRAYIRGMHAGVRLRRRAQKREDINDAAI